MNPAMKVKRIGKVFLLCLLPLIIPSLGLADEGMLEINQTCAVNDGCFAGDSPGFPVEITESGSYVLTGMLEPPSDQHGIFVNADGVSIDFGGFGVKGPESCSDTPVTSCSGTEITSGVRGNSASEVSVSNGRVTGVPGIGIFLGARARVTDFKFVENGGKGVAVGEDSRIENVEARRNGDDGIVASDRTVVREAIVSGNATDGIDMGNFGVVVDSVVQGNGSDGIPAIKANVIRNSTVSENGGDGIFLFNGSSVVTDSSITDNAGFGVVCSSGESGLKGNVFRLNNDSNAQIDGSCIELGNNLCGSNLSC